MVKQSITRPADVINIWKDVLTSQHELDIFALSSHVCNGCIGKFKAKKLALAASSSTADMVRKGDSPQLSAVLTIMLPRSTIAFWKVMLRLRLC